MTSKDKTLADKIRWYRKENGWTQEQLSEKIGTHLTYMSYIEEYKRGISLPILFKLAEVFKIKVKDLFDF